VISITVTVTKGGQQHGLRINKIDVLRGGDDFAAALKGDPAAAIAATFSMMPIEEMTLKADVAMTALLRCALEGNAAAALVLAQVRTRSGTPSASSWRRRSNIVFSSSSSLLVDLSPKIHGGPCHASPGHAPARGAYSSETSSTWKRPYSGV
jgi:hypothetical protein